MLYQINDYDAHKSTLVMASIDKLNQYIFNFEFKHSKDFERFKEKFLDIFNSYIRIVSDLKPGNITADGQFLALLPGEKEALKCFAVIQKLAKWEFQLHFFAAGHENAGILTEITKNIVLSTELEITKLGNQSVFSQSFVFRDANQPVSQSIHIKCGSIEEMMEFLSTFHAFITLAQMNKLYPVEKPVTKETPKITNPEPKKEEEPKENTKNKSSEEQTQKKQEENTKNKSSEEQTQKKQEENTKNKSSEEQTQKKQEEIIKNEENPKELPQVSSESSDNEYYDSDESSDKPNQNTKEKQTTKEQPINNSETDQKVKVLYEKPQNTKQNEQKEEISKDKNEIKEEKQEISEKEKEVHVPENKQVNNQILSENKDKKEDKSEIKIKEEKSPEIKVLYQKPHVVKEEEPIKVVEIKDKKEENSEIKVLYEKPQKPKEPINNSETNDNKPEKSETNVKKTEKEETKESKPEISGINVKKPEKEEIDVKKPEISEANDIKQEISETNDNKKEKSETNQISGEEIVENGQNEEKQQNEIISDKSEVTKSELPPDYYYISPFEGKPFKFKPEENQQIQFGHIYEEDLVPDASDVKYLDLNEKVTFSQKISKKENFTENLSLFVKPSTVDFTQSEIENILSNSLSEFQDDNDRISDKFTKPSFEGIGIINEHNFSKMTSKFEFDTSLLFEENKINFKPTKSEKPNCPFIEELSRTVQSMRISGLSVHREEIDSLKLTPLLTSLFLNDRKEGMSLESIKSILPSYEKEIDEFCRKSDITLQIFNFCIYGLNDKFILPFFRIIRRKWTWIDDNYNESSLLKNDNVLETIIDLLEPLVVYHTFVLSASISIDEEIINKYSKKAFSYRTMIDLPNAKENHEIFVKTVSDCLFDGLKIDLLDFVSAVSKEYKDIELEITVKKAKKLPPKQYARTIVGDALSTNNLLKWICMFISRADKSTFENDANLFDPYRYNLILKSLVLSLK
ncbi:hypothetical protein TVAG_415720 [Trichomonas vaginalis G3]|uniref:RUN domain-containing protein n=1 Tax=Trichomonas vaginalis (strain ATCC PRA-98 / G3) TaxID=412133 RepID=A2FWW6_TRIV3|nr:hypothetical protein TVAGG3_0106340 [Trichomonas vaginalis G3]EAX90595.1 hypothetical protein TVAG_415720 [Trichomonas vaginalis G3]KAI5544686.1 hypothetical protein TVAGG3_0106340 [Trichomonas vaginalis G3]|eukprot:XP_001303525.1 hypothetical protein [Trichomonas vaginalis G3]